VACHAEQQVLELEEGIVYFFQTLKYDKRQQSNGGQNE